MTRTANARLAGFTFLFYIAGITGLALAGQTHATALTSVVAPPVSQPAPAERGGA